MSGRYVTVETDIWVELFAELERRKLEGLVGGLSKIEKLIHEIYVARTQDKVEEVNRLLDQLFFIVFDKRV